MDNETEKLLEALSSQVNTAPEEKQTKSDSGAYFRKYENLTYEEALQYMSEGRAVRLPEWEGVWFMISNEIWVFTKHGELLNTPHIEEYSKRNDWNVKTGDVPHVPVNFVKALRQRADNTISYINALPRSRETALSGTACQTGFMWLGLYLAELGAANPYPKSSDYKSPVIEKHADKAETDHLAFIMEQKLDETATVKALRSDLQFIIDCIYFIDSWAGSRKKPQYVAIDRFIEAKLWLGQQLNNIRVANEAS